ncbi:MAG: glycosyltransferase family 2 protein [Casimicrobiaceae bacterium]
MNQPLISVVTPFRNTAPYLAQCIESVLAQTYRSFEYILVDNCSDDGAIEIAESYARRDSRIRLYRQPDVLPQVRNYNNALTRIDESSWYCKIVQADDAIFPECLRLMAMAFEQSKSIGLVSSYYLKGNTVLGSGLPYATPILDGKEMARLFLRSGVYVFGSPTTVAFRSSIVRSERPFYDESLLHEDTEKCMQILRKWDIGFVHQVLSFLRVENESISSSVRSFGPNALDWYIIVQRYASIFLDSDEAGALKARSRRDYYRFLAREALKFRERAFWRYHRSGLNSLEERMDRPLLATQVGLELLSMALNPGTTVEAMIRYGRRARHDKKGRSS